MRRKSVLLPIFLTLLVAMLPFAAGTQSPFAPREFAPVQGGFVSSGEEVLPYAPDRIIVQFTEDAMENAKFNILPMERGAALPGADTGLSSVNALVRQFGVTSITRPFVAPKNERMAIELGVDRFFMLNVSSRADIPTVVQAFAADPNVENASPDWRAFPAVVPNDPLHADHWGHNNTAQLLELDWGGTYEHIGPGTVGTPGFDSNGPEAWDASQGYGSSSIVIAILDSGVDVGHPDLNQVTGYDYGDNDSNPDDNSGQPGHGTACAGVAAAIANNGIGPAGIAGGCSIMPLKVANNAGQMFFSSIINAIYHAADNGADFISMSFSADISSDPSTDTAIQYAFNANCVLLAATSNDNQSHIHYPANNANVIGVGAASPCGERKRSSSLSSEVNPGVSTDPNGWTCDGERWWGSNYGVNTQDHAGAVDIIAPTILPTTDIQGSAGYDPGNYDLHFNGTSCSTPYAAGVCALIKSQNPGWSNVQIRNQLVNTAIDVVSVESGAGWDRYSGYGMVDAEAAVGGGGGPVAPVADFTASPTSGDYPLNVNFTDLSSGSPTSWSWTFGDGGTSSAQNPSHTYTSAGTYTVTLTATNSAGSDGETKTNYITVTEPGSGYANLPYSTGFESGSFDQYWSTTSSDNGRVRLLTSNGPHSGSYHMTMDDPTNGGYVTNEAWLHLNLAGAGDVDLDFWWKDFSDESHSQDGVFFSDNGGASFVKVLDLPGQSYSNNTWNNFVVDVDAAAASAGLSMTSTFVIKFQQYDNYPIATDGHAYDDISVTEQTPQPPTAEFSGSPTSGTAPLNVDFTDASTGATSWSWTFGDGGTSTAQNPSHTYTAAGTYTVALTATNAVGSDVETKTNYITVNEPGGGGDPEVITYDDFESGWGNFVDGGNDCRRYGGSRSPQGTYSIEIRDNSGVASSTYHGSGHNVSGYSEQVVEFEFYPSSMDNSNEDFWLQYYDGSSWVTLATWAAGIDFNNGTFYIATVTIPGGAVNFPTNAQLRFMCDASGNGDDVYIDAVNWTGVPAGGSSASLGGEITVVTRAERTFDTAGMEMDERTGLRQNTPNPFNPNTTISFTLEDESFVTLEVFNVAGQRVATLVNETKGEGVHSVVFDASRMSSGVYFYRLTAGEFSEIKKMVLLK